MNRSAGWSAALLVLLGLLLHAPGISRLALDGEEGRRAVPAREMIASGDYVRPTVWGRTYVNKPPLSFWTIAAVTGFDGPVTPVAARLPSLLATLLTALALLAFGARHLSPRAGLIAGLLFLMMPTVFAKGCRAEIEPVFTLLVFGALALGWSGARGSTPAAVGAGLLLGAAGLSKGPPAWAFYGAGLGALALFERSRRPLLSGRALLAIGLGLLPPLLWFVALRARVDSEALWGTWSEQMGGGAFHLDVYLGERVQFVLRVLGAFLPASLLAIAAAWSWRRGGRPLPPAAKLAAAVVLAGFLFFLVSPRARSRLSLIHI